MENMKIGDRIKKYRELAGITQTELIERLKWKTQSRLSGYERNARSPAIKYVEQIADELGIPRLYLFLSENEYNPLLEQLRLTTIEFTADDYSELEAQADLINRRKNGNL